MSKFGELVKEIRKEKRMTLRSFCKKAGWDPSNWSKIERGLRQPPKDRKMINEIADNLGLSDDSERRQRLYDYAALARIPDELIGNREIVDKLPVFLRTVRGEAPTREELEKLIDTIRQAESSN